MSQLNGKKIRKVIIILLCTVLLCISLLLVFLNQILKYSVENIGSKICGTEISLDAVNLSIFKGRLELSNLKVGNPAGYSSEYLLSLGTLNAEISMSSLSDKKIVIREITAKNVSVNFESKLTTNNIQDVINQLSSPQQEEKKTENTQTKNLQVDLLELQNIRMNVCINGVKSGNVGVAISIKPLHNLGNSPEGISAAELSVRILAAIMENAVNQGVLSVSEVIMDTSNLIIDSGKKVQNDLTGVMKNIIRNKESEEQK